MLLAHFIIILPIYNIFQMTGLFLESVAFLSFDKTNIDAMHHCTACACWLEQDKYLKQSTRKNLEIDNFQIQSH